MVVETQSERHPATMLHAHVATVSTSGSVGCPQQRQWAIGKCAGGGGGAFSSQMHMEVTVSGMEGR